MPQEPETESTNVASVVRALRHRGKYPEALAYLQSMVPIDVLGTSIVTISYADLYFKLGLPNRAGEVVERALTENANDDLDLRDSLSTVILRLQLALARCETKGTLKDAKSLCDKVKEGWFGDSTECVELTIERVWMEIYYHEIILLLFHYKEDHDKVVECAVAERLGPIQERLQREERYEEALDILTLRLSTLPILDCVVPLVLFSTSVQTDWSRGQCYLHVAQLLLKSHEYGNIERELGKAESHFIACEHKIGCLDVQFFRACYPPFKPESLQELYSLRMQYRDLSYPYGELRALKRLATLALQQRLFELYHRVYLEMIALRESTGSRLGWCHDQFSLLAGSSIQESRMGAVYEGYAAIIETLSSEGFQTPAFLATCQLSFSIVLQKLEKRSEAVEWAQRALDSCNARNDLILGSEAATALVFAKRMSSPSHAQAAEFARDMAECVDILKRWAEIDRDNDRVDIQIEKYNIIAGLECSRADFIGKSAAHDNALEWFKKAEDAVPNLIEEARTLARAEIMFKRHSVFNLVDDLENSFKTLQSACDLFSAAQSPQTTRMHNLMGLNRLLAFETQPSAGAAALNDALDHFREEKKGLEQMGLAEKLSICHFNIAGIWHRAHLLGQEDALPDALENLEAAERIRDELRYEFSTLAGADNLSLKHALVAHGEKIYSLGLKICSLMGDADKAWSWVQRGKARSLLDIMGLGVVIPTSISKEISKDPDLVKLLETERSLTAKMQALPPARRFDLRKQLSEVQKEMRGKPGLQALLSIRGEAAIGLPDVDSMFKSGDNVVCVDWACFGQTILLLAVRPGGKPRMLKVGLTLDKVVEWKRNYFSTEDLRDEENDWLRELDPLVADLKDLTTDDDILVLSPSGPLHALPLHALRVGNGILLERNPVVYSSSLSILRHCLKRRSDEVKDTHWKAVIFGDPTEDRRQAAASAKSLGELFHTEPRIGKTADKQAFKDLSPSANLFHYHGHAKYNAAYPLESALILATKEALTARHIFETDLKALLVCLIACSSGAQTIDVGDEPTGLVPAFLYAGANAVVGTLWRVRDTDGADFSKSFYTSLAKEGLLNLAVALRRAALEIRAKRPQPYYWASFVLHGNWLCEAPLIPTT